MATLRRFPVTIALVLITVALNLQLAAGWEDRIGAMLELTASGFRDGSAWTLVTANFVHVSKGHFLFDLIATAVLGLIYESDYGWHLATLILLSCLAIGVSFLLFCERLDSYRGLSGVTHCLFAAGMVVEFVSIRKGSWQRVIYYCILALFLYKLGHETVTGNFFWTMSKDVNLMGLPVPEAHLSGALVGFFYGAFALYRRHKSGAFQTGRAGFMGDRAFGGKQENGT